MQVEKPKTWFARHPKKRPPFDTLKLLGTALVVIAVMFALFPLFDYVNRKLRVGPVGGFWIRRVIFYGLIGGGYIIFSYWKKFSSRRPR
jgi:hypothetical protein